MRKRVAAVNDELGRMVAALVESWPALILAALFVLAAFVVDCGGLR